MSEAEGFIFLSACLAGMVYGKTYWQAGWSALCRRTWDRAAKIYLIHLAVIVPAVLAAWLFAGRLFPLANHFHDFLLHPWEGLALIPLLLHQPPLFDILPLYIIFLLATPGLLALGRRLGWKVVLIFSALGWLAAQFPLGVHLNGDPSRGLPLQWGSFNLFAWQLVWVSGLAFGETALHRPLLAGPSRLRVAGISGFIVAAGLAARHGFCSVNPDCYLWMDKWTLGPLRLLNFAAWVGLLLAWNPRVPASLLSPLALLGRHSLAVFSFHLPLVIIASTVIQMLALAPAEQILVGLLVIATLFPWAAWLERNSRPAVSTPVAVPISTRRLSLRGSDRPAEPFPSAPLRPLFPRVRASARIVHV